MTEGAILPVVPVKRVLVRKFAFEPIRWLRNSYVITYGDKKSIPFELIT